MKRAFLAMLVCPECRGELSMFDAVEEQGEIKSAKLGCPNGHGFPVRDFVPRFVPADAYVSSFSFEWTTHQTTQLDSVTKRDPKDPESSDAIFRAKTGFKPGALNGKYVLDGGCGVGRFAEIAANDGAHVVGVDLSFAVDSAMKNIGHRPNVNIVQADLFKLPFRDAGFDVVYSIGVLHHTPSTKQAFFSISRCLKPGGDMAIYVYPKIAFLSSVSDAYRKITTKLPSPLLHALCYLAVPYYYLTRIPVLGMGFHLLWPISHRKDWRWRVLDTFDWYSPTYQWKHTWPEVYAWFVEAGYRDMACHPYAICMSAIKK
ncbi:MAG TPA: methyltransferase domain-containing protein [Verrucomicrobiae bacterium]|nr:methyltransferase domain-containing protein [Verrucomicrobiae bacterium]